MNKKEQVKRAVSHVCNCADCLSPFTDCPRRVNQSKAGEIPPLPKLGDIDECPLMQFEINGATNGKNIFEYGFISDFKPMALSVCRACKHAIDNIDDYTTYCLNCPMHCIIESIEETEAEARCS